MKRKFLAIVSLLIAIVMSFALIACNEAPNNPGTPDNPDNPDKPDKPSVTTGLTVGKISDAVDTLIDLENGYKATVKLNATSASATETAKGELSLEKRGSKIKTTVVEGDKNIDVYIDLASGYVYNTNLSGKLTTDGQMIPAGFVEYVGKAFGDIGVDKSTVIKNENGVSFDETTKTFTVKVDLKDEVNTIITPLIDAYKNNSTAKKLVNDYIALYDETLDIDGLLNTGIEFIDGVKDMTIGAVLTQAQISLEDILAQAGAEIDKDTLAMINNRKIGDALTGAIDYVETNMESIMAGTFDPNELIAAVLTSKVDNSTLKTKLNEYKGLLIELLNNTKIKDTVDKLANDPDTGLVSNPVFATVYTILTDEIKVDKLAAELSVVFDADYRITKIAGKADFAHTYKGTGMTTGLFSDNAYHADFELSITEYTATATAWTLETDPESDRMEYLMVITDGSADFTAYYELFGKEVEIKVAGVTANCGDTISVLDATGVTFDAEKSAFVISKATFDAAKKKTGFTGEMGIGAVVTPKDGEKYTMHVSIMGVTEDRLGFLQQLASDLIGDLIERVPNEPDHNIGSGEVTETNA